MNGKAFLLIAFILLFSGCFSQPTKPAYGGNNETVIPEANNTPSVTVNITGGCEDLLDANLRNNCIYDTVMNNATKDSAACYKIIDQSLRDRCMYVIAASDPKTCGLISDASIELRDNCYYSHADATGKDEYCLKIADASKAKKCNDLLLERLCNQSNDYEQAFCLAKKTKMPEYCEPLNISRQKCYLELAKEFSNESICASIDTLTTRKACEGIISGNYDLCLMLPFNSSQDACYQVIAVDKNDDAICDKTVTDTYINSCHEELALMNNKPSLCSHSVSELQKNLCYKDVAIKYGQVETCVSIIEDGIRDSCRMEIAKALGEPALCTSVENPYFRNFVCYNQVLASNNQSVLSLQKCDGIPENDMSWRDECYKRMAILTGNFSICDMIHDEGIKSRCG
jgi:hypothetical protein